MLNDSNLKQNTNFINGPPVNNKFNFYLPLKVSPQADLLVVKEF